MKRKLFDELTYEERRKLAISYGIRPTGTWQPMTQRIYESSKQQKPKELDWEKEFDETFWEDMKPHNGFKSFIKKTLTQQRTELLEEIKKSLPKSNNLPKHKQEAIEIRDKLNKPYSCYVSYEVKKDNKRY